MKKKYTINTIGEFGFIDIIKKRYSSNKHNKNIITHIGDDAFCFKSGKEALCVTKDMLIEDVHFKQDWTTPYDLGRKAVEINISDIAAMGAVKPKYVFVGLGMPSFISLKYAEKLYKGIQDTCDKYGAFIAGGDTVKSDKIVISVTVVGACKPSEIVNRNGAKSGDFIGVTGTFGDVGAGVDLLYKYGVRRKYNADEKILIAKQNLPQARIKEARIIAKYASSMTDASDGLYVSVELLAKESKRGADISLEKVPVSLQLKEIVKNASKCINYALFGAEDFELVFTVPQNKADALKRKLPGISYIGRINSSKKVKYFHNGKMQNVKYKGFKHF